MLDQGIIQGLFNARYSHLKKFTIMCTDEGACETNAEDFRNNIIPYWIEYFFKDPRYLTVDGKPVLSIYHYGNWLRMFGGPEGGRAAIQVLRDEVAKAGMPGIIVLMEERSGDEKVLRTIKSLGADYCYSYTWGTKSAQIPAGRMITDATIARPSDSRCSPAFPWDGTARPGACMTAGGSALRITRSWPNGPATGTCPRSRRVLWAGDGPVGQLERTRRRPLHAAQRQRRFWLPGRAVRNVFTSGGPHRDAKPTEQQTRRYNVLFPKDWIVEGIYG